MSTTLTERLSQTERVEWTLQLSIVERGRDGFWKTVEALATIRQKRLFREEFESFDAFVSDRLDMSSRYANILIRSANARTTLGTVVPETTAAKINSPWKLRNLAGLTTEKMVEVVEHAELASAGGEVTAKQLAASRREVLGLVDTEEPDTEADDSLETFREALAEIDSVDALLLVLESLGSVEDQALILGEVAPELCDAIRHA